MKLSLGAAGLLVLAACSPLAFVACAVTEQQGEPPLDVDGAALPPGPDANAPTDAGAEAEADAPARVCSDQGFCHTPVPPDQTLRAVWGDGAGAAWAVSEQGAVLRWDGAAWQVHTKDLGPLFAVWGSGPTDVWVGGEGGLHHGTGATAATLTFTAVAAPGDPTIAIRSIWGTSASDVWAVGGNGGEVPTGRVLHLTASGDAGASWTLDPASAEALAFTHVWGTAASGVWLAGSRPIPGDEFFTEVIVLRRPAGAPDFAPVALPSDPQENPTFGRLGLVGGVSPGGESTMWILGRTAGTLHGIWRGASADSGQSFTWTYERYGRADDPGLNAAFGTAANDVWAAGDYGRLRHWDGKQWSQAAITLTKFPVTEPFYGLWSKGPDEVWVVGDGVALYRKK